MPELPDLTVYLECLEQRALEQRLTALRLSNPFVLRTVTPKPADFENLRLVRTARLGKRLVLHFADDAGGMRYAVIHLMRLGRLHWKRAGAPLGKGSGLAAFDFEQGTLLFTESGSKRRASLHLFADAVALAALDRGGLEVLAASFEQFSERLRRENLTVKRALADPRLLAGIGNAYSDEILHRARLSPFKQTQALDEVGMHALYVATRAVLSEWTARLRAETRDGWPDKVTAFRPQMAAHGRYGQACPVCGTKIARVVYADNEMNYCPRCQTGGRLLADRALSRLLHDSWPKTIDEAES